MLVQKIEPMRKYNTIKDENGKYIKYRGAQVLEDNTLGTNNEIRCLMLHDDYKNKKWFEFIPN